MVAQPRDCEISAALYSAGEPSEFAAKFGSDWRTTGGGEARGSIAIVAYDSGAGMTEMRSLNLSQVNS
jgi:hypothetical protein